MIYSEYLKTEHWQNVKKEALQRADYHCQLCNNIKKLDVHHNNYGCLWHEKPSDVIVLCKRCHAKHHDKIDRLVVPHFVQNPGAGATDSDHDQRHENCDLNDLDGESRWRKTSRVD